MMQRSGLSRAISFLVFAGVLALAWHLGTGWLKRHPEHDPWAPLDLRHPVGWATASKLGAVRADPSECRAVLERSDIAFDVLEPVGDDECRRDDRTLLTAALLTPGRTSTTCSVAAGFEFWMFHGVQPAANEILGSPVARIEHLGAFSCRRINGSETGRWSEHATGNAIDIAAFVLEDGRRVSVLNDWQDAGEKSVFLSQVRDKACDAFGTVLSPDYNAAHADHFHLDQAARGYGAFCR